MRNWPAPGFSVTRRIRCCCGLLALERGQLQLIGFVLKRSDAPVFLDAVFKGDAVVAA
jgi:hypothetical protein